jgi:hypothetical protein
MSSAHTRMQDINIFKIEVYWIRIKQKQDFLKRSQFRESLGNPSNPTFNKWLRNPGLIPMSKAIACAKFLSREFGDPINALDLGKTF